MEMPTNLEAERGLLGIIITANDTVFDVGNLTADDFAEPANGELFKLLQDQIEAGRSVTAATLLHDAQDQIVWGDLKASDYLFALERNAPPPSVSRTLAQAIVDVALRRRLLETLAALQEKVVSAPVSIPAEKLRSEVDDELSQLFTSPTDLGVRQFPQVSQDIIERAAKQARGDEADPGLRYGLSAYENLAGPGLPGRFYVISGLSGAGKSALTSQLMESVALQGKPVLIVSPEMDDEETVSRLLSAETGVPVESLERGLIDYDQFNKLMEAHEARKTLPLFIDPGSRPSVPMIRARALRLRSLVGLAAIAVDHLHYLQKPDRRQSNADAFDENLAGLKALAKDLGIPIFGLCHMTAEAVRDLGRWPHRLPTQSDLMFASSVDKHSDATVIVHRREYVIERNRLPEDDKDRARQSAALEQERDWAQLVLVKRRGGKGWGTERCCFDAQRVRFRDGEPPSRYGRPNDWDDESLFR